MTSKTIQGLKIISIVCAYVGHPFTCFTLISEPFTQYKNTQIDQRNTHLVRQISYLSTQYPPSLFLYYDFFLFLYKNTKKNLSSCGIELDQKWMNETEMYRVHKTRVSFQKPSLVYSRNRQTKKQLEVVRGNCCMKCCIRNTMEILVGFWKEHTETME